jgi:uncharacterized protein (DUF2147 family)
MKFAKFALVAFALVFVGVASQQAAAVGGTYLRKGSQKVKVWVSGGKLYCQRMSDKFEMCHGMTKSGNKWTGSNMKHPDMPSIFTFNGTVTFGATSLKIKGCAIGQSLCDAEVWKLVK